MSHDRGCYCGKEGIDEYKTCAKPRCSRRHTADAYKDIRNIAVAGEEARAAEKPGPGGGTREFQTGAFRNTAQGKLDYDGFISPLALEAYGTYLDFHRTLEDGTIRDSDNWQKGIPVDVYRKSAWRHWFESWKALRGYTIHENIIWALCGVMFNVQGLLHELIKKDPHLVEDCKRDMIQKRERMWRDKREAANRSSPTPGAIYRSPRPDAGDAPVVTG